MTTRTKDKNGMEIERIVRCPYCGASLEDTKPPSHFPCEQTPTTAEVVAALKDAGVRR